MPPDAPRARGSDPLDDAANPHLLARTLPRLYYRRERLMTLEAKRRFVPPDLAPLPPPEGGLPAPPG